MAAIEDTADWEGVTVRSIDVGARNKGKKNLNFKGIDYATVGEVALARMLTRQRIPFTPNVPFFLKNVQGKPGNYVPDFVLNRIPYVWEGSELVHGFEAKGVKGNDFSAKAVARVTALRRELGIVIMLISDNQILKFAERGGLPLAPLGTD